MLAAFAMFVTVYLSHRAAGRSDGGNSRQLQKVARSVELSAGCYVSINNTP
jgi:hypothetical protein